MQNNTTHSRANITVRTLLAACMLAGLAAQPVLAQTASALVAPALVAKPKPTHEAPFKAPDLASLAHEPNGAEILYGYRLMTQTKKLLPNNVGAAMNCTSCHLGGGFVPHSSAFVGQDVLYPLYNSRAARVVSMAD
ncbi:MAG: cytochrome C, partial [Thiomonas sp.]|nr:cytochrome C [Thiomonas sp.]